MFGPQGRDILEELKALPKRNVSVRAVSSIPSVATDSTDLKVLRENGHEVHMLIYCIHIWLCIVPVTKLYILIASLYRSVGQTD